MNEIVSFEQFEDKEITTKELSRILIRLMKSFYVSNYIWIPIYLVSIFISYNLGRFIFKRSGKVREKLEKLE